MRIQASFFENSRCVTPKQGELRMAAFEHVIGQKDGPAYSLCLYRPGTTRRKKNIAYVTGVGFDYDGLKGEEENATLSAWEGLKYEALMHTTYSNTPVQTHFRVIVPFSAPAHPAQLPLAWDELNRATGGLADSACRDASRLFFFPRVAMYSDLKLAAIKFYRGKLYTPPEATGEETKHVTLPKVVVPSNLNIVRALDLPDAVFSRKVNINVRRVKEALRRIGCELDTKAKCRVEHESNVNGFAIVEAGDLIVYSNPDGKVIVRLPLN